MILYHYSKDKYKSLLTLSLQGVVSDEDKQAGLEAAEFRGEPYPYYEHVSFFIEPVPVDIMASLYPSKHKVWRKGNKLYEYQIDTQDIDIKHWRLIETPANAVFLDTVPWLESATYKKLYFQLRRWIVDQWGDDAKSLVAAVKPYLGTTKDAFIKASQHKDFKDFNTKYAANVTHLMVYTDKAIKIKATNRVTVNSDPVPTVEERTYGHVKLNYLKW